MYFLARLTMTGWKMNNKTIQNMHLKLLEDYPKNLEVPPNRIRLLQGICLPNDASIHFSFGISETMLNRCRLDLDFAG